MRVLLCDVCVQLVTVKCTCLQNLFLVSLSRLRYA